MNYTSLAVACALASAVAACSPPRDAVRPRAIIVEPKRADYLDGGLLDEEITLDDEGTLHVGDASIRVSLERPPARSRRTLKTEVVLFDRARAERALVLRELTPDEEDAPMHYQLVVVRDGGLRVVFDRVVGVYGITRFVFPGDGTARYEESGWTACERLVGEPMAGRDLVVLAVDPSTLQMVEHRSPSGEVQDCSQLAG